MNKHRIAQQLALGSMVLAMLVGCRGSNEERGTRDETLRVAQVLHRLAVADTLDTACYPDVENRYRACEYDVKKHVKRGQTLSLQTEGLTLYATEEAVRREGEYSVRSLEGEELPPLPQGMVNMTGAAAGYRLLPGGEHFLPYAELRVSYDPERLPDGLSAEDIYTSYYDTGSMAWVRLERVAVDTARHEIVSRTSHFTDFINELLKTPEMPETQAFVPTVMSHIETANPMDGLTLITPPIANNSGTVDLSYPLEIPAGREGMQPALALTYNSNRGSGWLGVGWDISLPCVTLDTRWGVPRYDSGKESEIYILNGIQLITKDQTGLPRPMPHRTNRQIDRLPGGTQYYARTGEVHDSIIRHGTTPREYWWEVIDRNGIQHCYGHYVDSARSSLACVLTDDEGNIARWPLCESRDLYGNTVRYYYDLVTTIEQGVAGRQLYIDSISYTGHGEQDGYYTIVFCRTENQTVDIPTSCNLGFKEVTGQVLNNVHVRYGNKLLTTWLFDMENSYQTNYKNRLETMAKIDSTNGRKDILLESRCQCQNTRGNPAGSPRTHSIEDLKLGYAGLVYTFDYYNQPSADSLFGPEIISDSLINKRLHGILKSDPHGLTDVSRATGLGLSHASSWNIGGTAAVGFGPVTSLTTLSIGGNYTRSQSASESLMTLVDLDGDGLADKVFVKDGKMYFCRHRHHEDGTITFDNPIAIKGATRFLRESSYSNTFGSQIAVGFSGSASWTNAKSTTSTYFADVNGD